jgi:hypothetical protein
VPDLPYTETCAFRDEAIKNDLELVPLFQPIITVFYWKKSSLVAPTIILKIGLIIAGAAYNTVYTGREDEGDH